MKGSGGRPRDPRDKIVTADRLESLLARRGRRRIVFTNGVFDLLHPGHVSLLLRARMLGDALIVAINTDASVRRLKGPWRPFIPARQRALMLGSLEAVDYVVTFGDDTPLRLVRRIRPDVLVKGGEWSRGTIVGRDVVEAGGGIVVRIPMLAGFSTTGLARSIRSRRTRDTG
jgi:D-beta-D-heptose 7-phosphate kinase/D-beta-D-heptose 1-phosphate adenosyltransferase